ncbi:hypothetical protein PHLCEN_2v2083 [Hermanssonia centrifuga]|uniref:Uncharacterized protein n=1 Tax=Hermanssonia centrifuga TaxID=98765 RepID=A0A2R6RQ42_9APHY|nr:hypothetical protein PHLCEN_2v2083 [Hermanssonia centrifuga]
MNFSYNNGRIPGSLLDKLEEECPENQHIDWFLTENPKDLEIVKCVAEILEMNPEVENDDTSKWQTLVPEHLHEFGDIFSRKIKENASSQAV